MIYRALGIVPPIGAALICGVIVYSMSLLSYAK